MREPGHPPPIPAAGRRWPPHMPATQGPGHTGQGDCGLARCLCTVPLVACAPQQCSSFFKLELTENLVGPPSSGGRFPVLTPVTRLRTAELFFLLSSAPGVGLTVTTPRSRAPRSATLPAAGRAPLCAVQPLLCFSCLGSAMRQSPRQSCVLTPHSSLSPHRCSPCRRPTARAGPPPWPAPSLEAQVGPCGSGQRVAGQAAGQGEAVTKQRWLGTVYKEVPFERRRARDTACARVLPQGRCWRVGGGAERGGAGRAGGSEEGPAGPQGLGFYPGGVGALP